MRSTSAVPRMDEGETILGVCDRVEGGMMEKTERERAEKTSYNLISVSMRCCLVEEGATGLRKVQIDFDRGLQTLECLLPFSNMRGPHAALHEAKTWAIVCFSLASLNSIWKRL
jgi:hypothetical protein